jgi:REP element-mobilizing transposase RayT
MYNFNKKLHRNSQQRFYNPDYFYFITTVTCKRFPFFKEELFCELFLDNLKICREIKKFRLLAFTILPDHVHLLVKPASDFNISQIMQFLKRHYSRDVNFVLNCNNEDEIRESRLHGGNYENYTDVIDLHDKRLIGFKNKFIQKYGQPQFDIPSFSWQQSFHDHVIRSEKDFYKHLNYIADNCINHGICENENKYPWSFLNEEFKDLLDDYTK